MYQRRAATKLFLTLLHLLCIIIRVNFLSVHMSFVLGQRHTTRIT